MNDLISRQKAIEALCQDSCGSGWCGVSCQEVSVLENLPPAKPEERTEERTETHACEKGEKTYE